MLYEIFVAAIYISINMLHQIIIAETIQIFIAEPMAIACTFGIYLHNFCAHCHIKTRRPPRVRCSMGSVGGHIGCEDSTFIWEHKGRNNFFMIIRKDTS